MASPLVARSAAMAARGWMAWALACRRRRHGNISGRYGPQCRSACLDDFRPLPARRHRPGTCAPAPATAAMTRLWQRMKPLAMARAGAGPTWCTPSRLPIGFDRWLVGPAAEQRPRPHPEIHRSCLWCGSNGSRTGQDALPPRRLRCSCGCPHRATSLPAAGGDALDVLPTRRTLIVAQTKPPADRAPGSPWQTRDGHLVKDCLRTTAPTSGIGVSGGRGSCTGSNKEHTAASW